MIFQADPLGTIELLKHCIGKQECGHQKQTIHAEGLSNKTEYVWVGGDEPCSGIVFHQTAQYKADMKNKDGQNCHGPNEINKVSVLLLV